MPETSKSPEYTRIASLIETIQEHSTEILANERRLMTTKWFDYRFLSPKEANRLFARAYKDVYRKKIAQEVDRDLARNVSGLNAQTLATIPRERTQLVFARQRADEFGMSYPVYIEAAFDFALRRGGKRKALPRPNQLHGNKKSAPLFIEYVTQRWQELLASSLGRVEHPAYLIENYRGMPAQDDFRRFVLDYVKQANMPLHRAIRMFTYERKQVPADLFGSMWPQEQFERAMQSVESDLRHMPIEDVTPVPVTSSQLWPTCFGMNYTHQPSSPECSSCPLASNCERIGDFVMSKAAAQAGAADPAGDYHRRLGRNRKRKERCRGRERMAKDAGGFGTPLNPSPLTHA